MPTPTYIESGSDATFDLATWLVTAVSATNVTSATDQPFFGPRAIKLTMASADIDAENGVAALADAGRRITFWFRLDAYPTGIVNFFEIRTSGSLAVYRLAMNTTGTLRSVPVGATAADGATVAPLNQWNRVTLSFTITNTTTFRFELYLNGILQVSSTAGTLTRVGANRMRLRLQTAVVTTGTAWWFKHVYVDDGNDYTDPGAIFVTAKRPLANGSANGYTTQIGSGGSGYGSGHAPQVNERPLSVTNGWSFVGDGSQTTEEYNIEGLTVGDVNIGNQPILAVMGWIWINSLVPDAQDMIVDGTLTVKTSPVTAQLFTQMSATPTVYPAGAGADIGVRSTGTLTTFNLYECGIQVAYRGVDPSQVAALLVGYFPAVHPLVREVVSYGEA